MLNRIDYTALRKISRDWFEDYADTVGIIISRENTIYQNRFLFGCVAGPAVDLFNLTHEMAHMIEIDVRRCHYPDWHFKYGKEFYIPGPYGGNRWTEMTTTKAVDREIRVFGIQLALNRHYGIFATQGLLTRESYYMATLTQYVQNYMAYGPPYSEEFEYSERESLAFAAIEQRILDHHYHEWDFESVRRVWHARMLKLRAKRKRGCWKSYGDDDWRIHRDDVYV